MRASVLFEPGKPLEVEEVSLAPPQAEEVVVRMTASGVCHSCLHTADGSLMAPPRVKRSSTQDRSDKPAGL